LIEETEQALQTRIRHGGGVADCGKGAAGRARAADRGADRRSRGRSLSKANLAALWEALAKLGWVEGRNLRIDLRFPDLNRIRASAAELVNLAPDVIVIYHSRDNRFG
jgi:hypothetical protein